MANYIPNGRQQFCDANGTPLALGTVGMYVVGTLTPSNTWQDAGQAALNTNPLTLDAGGFASIYGNGSYRQIVKDLLGNVVWDRVVTVNEALINADGHRMIWGTTSVPAWDTTSDYQAFFLQTQPSFLSNGSLGALYAQRLATYSGGAASDAAAPVVGASRSYTQIASTVGRAVEAGHLAVIDNYSTLAQGVGIYGQGNSHGGGRVWGGIDEAHEVEEVFTATAAQTVFSVPNGFNSVAAVTKNGTLLTVTTDYTLSSPNVTLTSGATVGDIIKVYRGDPQQGIIGRETDIFAGPGTDTANPISGNRIGHAMFAYRRDKSINVAGHVGTLLALISDPSDAFMTVDRGIQPQGKFGTVIDLTASNFTATGYFIKSASFNVDASGNLSTTGSLGYRTGAGGAVTQATSRTTGVTLNKTCGQITLFSAAGSASWQTFTVTNSAVAATDVIRLNQASGADKYMLHVTKVQAGSFDVTFATTGGTTTEQPVFNFAAIKAVAA